MHERVDLLLVQNFVDDRLYDSIIVPFGKAHVGDLVEYADTIGRVVTVVEFLKKDSSVIEFAETVSVVYSGNLTVYVKCYEEKEEENNGESV